MRAMRAVLPEIAPDLRPHLGDVPDPVPGPGEVLVDVAAAGLNRADLLQVRGQYPPPAGESTVPGLECAGTVAAVGRDVAGWHVGDRVMALLAGGGHGERVAVPVGQLMRVPDAMPLTDAAALPEAALTAWTNLVVEGGLRAGETVLVTGATSGVGTFAVQLAHALGARVFAAARSLERVERLRTMGADVCLALGDELPAKVKEATGGVGADLVMDLVGGPGVRQHLAALGRRGRLVLVGLMAGARAEIELDVVLRQRLRIVGSVLRPRSRAEKAELVAGFSGFAAPRLADGRLRPVVDRVFPFSEVATAYAAMAAGGAIGKIVLQMR